MGHTSEKNDGVVAQGGSETFDITFYDKDPDLGGTVRNPDGYNPGNGPVYEPVSGFVTAQIMIYDSVTGTFSSPSTQVIAPILSNIRYGGTTGKFLVDVACPSNGTLSSSLTVGRKWAIVWSTTINTITLSGALTAETFEVIPTGAADFGTNFYASVEAVAGFLTANQFPIDVNSVYTREMVEMYMEVAMGEIEQITHRCWRPKKVVNEELPVIWNYSSNVWTGYVCTAKPLHYPIQSFQKVEMLKTSDWLDATAEEGRTGKWYADYQRGLIFCRWIMHPFTSQNKVRVSYTYGEDREQMPPQIKMATIIRTAWYMLQSDDYSVTIPDGGDNIRPGEKIREWDSKFSELVIPTRNGLVWR